MNSHHRILVVSHAHPDFSLGGGELAAYNLYRAYRDNPAIEDAWFIGRVDRGRGATGAMSVRRINEYLWEQAVADYDGTAFKAMDVGSVLTKFADLIRALNPTVVHAHHYAHLGLEFLRVIKQINTNIRIVMTLHEFMAICRNNGQMIKTNSFKLCSRESYDECRLCFPESTAEDFWLRKHYFMSYFSFVDRFVSPSEFLRQRYIQWGIAPAKIDVIENGQLEEPTLPPRRLEEGEARNRFGFFGQVNQYKGLDVMLKALHDLPKSERKKIVLEVHGANLELQEQSFRRTIEALLEPLMKQGVVQWIGSYQSHELRNRMAGVDWVVVPSIWWENSPMVIQEAFLFGRPVICSNIGGMAEKVRDGVDGLHVSVGNVYSWGQILRRASADHDLWQRLSAGIERPTSYASSASKHLGLLERST